MTFPTFNNNNNNDIFGNAVDNSVFSKSFEQPKALGFDGPKFDNAAPGFGNRTVELATGAIRSVRVISCSFCEMVEQAPMNFRPFVSKVNDTDVLDMIPDFVRENRPGAGFRSESMNGIVHDIVALSANPMGIVPIVNGWNTRRYSFTIMAEVVRSTGNTQNYLVEGFTDTPEIGGQGSNVYVSPDLVLYVNNVVSFAERTNINNGTKSFVPLENYNIINKDPFDSNAHVNNLVTQRPYDIANMSLSGTLVGNASKIIMDTRANVATDPKTSSLNNNNPATYVAKIINEGITAIDASNTDSLFNATTIRNMVDKVIEPSLAKNGFLNQLGRLANDYPTSVTSFTWRDLIQLDPALANPTCPYLNVITLKHRAVHLPSTGFACQDINGSGNEQVFATMIANSLSDAMAQCRASSVTIMGTNHGGIDTADVTEIQCFDQRENKFQTSVFEKIFISNIMTMVNQNTKFAYNVLVQSCIWGETYIKINLGYGTYDFLFPNFANSMYSPMLTNNKVGTENISRHLLSVANRINDEQCNQLTSLSNQGFSSSPI